MPLFHNSYTNSPKVNKSQYLLNYVPTLPLRFEFNSSQLKFLCNPKIRRRRKPWEVGHWNRILWRQGRESKPLRSLLEVEGLLSSVLRMAVLSPAGTPPPFLLLLLSLSLGFSIIWFSIFSALFFRFLHVSLSFCIWKAILFVKC